MEKDVPQKIGKLVVLKEMKIRYYIIACLLLCANLAFAQVKLTASASRTQVGTGETFEVSFSLNGNGSRFAAPDFSDFQVLSGPNVSSSYSSVNGRTSVSNTYSYYLTTVKEGTYTIGPASITVDDKRLSTAPITIKVVKGQLQQHNNQPQQAPENNVSAADLAKSIFIKTAVDKTNVYQGEQITVSFKLYTRVGIVDSRLDKMPDLNGFWSEDIKNPSQQAQWTTETYKGLKYNVAEVKKTILFAEHSGNIKIDPFEMTFIVRLQAPSSGDLIDQFFGGSYKDVNYNVKSLPVVIRVKPLPEAGKPASFTGAVGKFNVNASVDRSVLKSNESLNYKVTVSGSGNLKLLQTLNAEFPPDIEKYDPTIKDTVTQTAYGLSGSKVYNYLLIPRHQGEFVIDPVEFSYFNPATGKYAMLSTKPFTIKVEKGIAERNVTAFSSAEKQDVKVLDNDIRYIKTGDAGLSDGNGFFGSAGHILMLLVGPLACVAAFIYRNRNRRNNSDVVKVKSRQAGKVAAKHLANAETQLKAQKRSEFYEAIFKGLYGYLGDKLNLLAADLNKETIVAALQLRQLNEQLIGELIETLDLCEMARYAPVTQLSEQEVLEKAKRIINTIENEIK
ncbi:BatD family protein [Pedobacter sp. AW31-3R]|uniref:BatD family protein n=1 Tax=Pedobacter sp. AW31-3R TaxID=3445781 RepID=UPI003FA03E72